MRQYRTLVVILNWQQPALTEACVHAVQALKTPGVDILLVDNGSTDGSVAYLTETFPGIQLIALPENRGFAVGANAGLQHALQAGFDYALLLNNDAFPAPDMLDRLLAAASEDVALLSPKIYYDDARNVIWFAGARQHKRLLEMRDSGLNAPDSAAWNETRDVDYVLGTGLLVNLGAVRVVGWLDERFFMYYEDLDWSIRLREAGFRLRLVADAHLFHRVSTSSGGLDSPMQKYHLARSSVIFFRRHARKGTPALIILYRAASAIRTVTRLIFTGKTRSAKAYLRGLVDGWRVTAQPANGGALANKGSRVTFGEK